MIAIYCLGFGSKCSAVHNADNLVSVSITFINMMRSAKGGGVCFFRKKIVCSQSWPRKIVCFIKCGKTQFVHSCVRKKIDC